MSYYAVFDTNVLVSSLLAKRKDSPTAMVADAVAAGDLIPLYNQEILDGYNEVFHRAKFPFSENSIRRILMMIREYGFHIPRVRFFLIWMIWYFMKLLWIREVMMLI